MQHIGVNEESSHNCDPARLIHDIAWMIALTVRAE
jgi:hypothetical protein